MSSRQISWASRADRLLSARGPVSDRQYPIRIGVERVDLMGTETPSGNRGSGASGIEENIERADPASLEHSDIRACDDGWTGGRAGAPSEAAYTVVTDRRTCRAKNEAWRQAGEQRGYGFGDGG